VQNCYLVCCFSHQILQETFCCHFGCRSVLLLYWPKASMIELRSYWITEPVHQWNILYRTIWWKILS